MKRTVLFSLAVISASFAYADISISTNDSPVGSGKWYFTNYTGGGSATQWGGYFNKWTSFPTGDLFNNPIDKYGFFWKTGAGQEYPLNLNGWDTFWSETNSGGSGTVVVRSKTFNGTGNVLQYTVTQTIVPIAAGTTPANGQAYIKSEWRIDNLTGNAVPVQFYVLADLASRTSSLTSKTDDLASYSGGLTTFSGTNTPTIYFKNISPALSHFEVSNQGFGSTPAAREKMFNNAADTLDDAVTGSGASDWAAVYQYSLNVPANGFVKGQTRLGYNINPPSPAFIKGQVTLQNLPTGNPSNFPLVYSLRNGSSTLQSGTVTPDAAGNYAIETELSGALTLNMKASHWISVDKSVNLAGSDVTGVDASMVNGDVDNDDVVSVFDYIILSDAFDATPSDAGWDARADLDNDSVISVFDYIILSDNFDVGGPL